MIVIPPLPEGWSGTPDELLAFIEDNAEIQVDGEGATTSLAGQIGGSSPTADIGIWFSPTSIESYRDGKYQPITDVPIGCGLPYFGPTGAEPDNFLFMDGRSLIREDYPELFAVLGVTWGTDSGTTFSLPNPAGRVPYGAGIGDYGDNTVDSLTGKLPEVSVGNYIGRNWLRKEPEYPGIPTADIKSVTGSTIIAAGSQYAATYPAGFGCNWIIRYR